MPRSLKKSKKKAAIQPSFDDLDESLLLGGDDPEPTSSRQRRSSARKTSMEMSLMEAELLGEAPPVAVKKSKRRKTRSGSKTDKEKHATKPELDISLEIESKAKQILETMASLAPQVEDSPKQNKTPDTEMPESNVENRTISCHTTSDAVSEDLMSEEIRLEQMKPAPASPEPPAVPPFMSTDNSAPPFMSTDNSAPPLMDTANSAPPLMTTDNRAPAMTTDNSAPAMALLKPVLDVEEVDIYSDLSNDNVDTLTPEGGEEVTIDEVFKMNAKSPVKPFKPKYVKPISDNEDEDLDYEDEKELSQMKISVLVGGGPKDKHSRNNTRTDKTRPPLILPPLPHTHITIPPMLPLPPLPIPPTYCPKPTSQGNGRMIYINPKFKTEVILQNLEQNGIIKGGNVAVHMNRNIHNRSRSRSPIKCHSSFEYVPSPVIKQKIELDDPTTTLLITDLSVCTTRSRIKELFSSIGIVKEVLTYPKERRAVVTFENAKDAVVCRRKFHRSMVDGSYMTVNFAI